MDGPLVRIRQRAVGWAVEWSARGASRAAALHPASKPERYGIEVMRDVAYRDTGLAAHTLDIYRPRFRRGSGDEPLPVVLYAHGGGFRILSKDTHWMMGLGFARRGYLVFNINYRLAPRHAFPHPLEDAAAALSWVRSNARRYGGDPDHIVLAGESAGANLVSSLAVASSWHRPEPWAREIFESELVPKAVVPMCGILEVANSDRFLKDDRLPIWVRDRARAVCRGYLGAHADENAAALELASPLRVFEGSDAPARPLPPIFVSVGHRDPIVDDSRRLENALVRIGGTHRVRYYHGQGHAFQAMVWKKEARAAWRDCFDFLSENGA